MRSGAETQQEDAEVEAAQTPQHDRQRRQTDSHTVDFHMEDVEGALDSACTLEESGRLKAYGGFWREWVNKSHNQRRPKQIPPKHREKRLMRQEADGEYTIHAALLALAESTQPTSSSNRRPT